MREERGSTGDVWDLGKSWGWRKKDLATNLARIWSDTLVKQTAMEGQYG